jgi:KDO2-lipid IV(A) lauroyltransferase
VSVRRALGRIVVLFRVLRDLLLTLLVLVLAVPLWALPWRLAAALGALYGRAASFAWPIARRAGMINLRRAYGPGMDRATAARWVREAFGSLGRAIAEGVQFARRYKRGGEWGAVCAARDPGIEARVLADPRPKIFVTGHLGCWEMAMQAVALQSRVPGSAIARRVDNPFLNAVVRRVRLRSPSEWIEKRGATTEALRRLRRGENVALLADENGGPRGVFVPFFGRLASTHKTPAILAAMTGAPIVVGAAIREPGGRRFAFELAVVEPRPDAPDPAAEIARLSAEIAAILERWIREHPRQWRWIHWRWRDRPGGEQERYSAGDVDAAFGRAGAEGWGRRADVGP